MTWKNIINGLWSLAKDSEQSVQSIVFMETLKCATEEIGKKVESAEMLGYGITKLLTLSLPRFVRYRVTGIGRDETGRSVLMLSLPTPPYLVGSAGDKVWLYEAGQDPELYPNKGLLLTVAKVKRDQKNGYIAGVVIKETVPQIEGEGWSLVVRPWSSSGLGNDESDCHDDG
jgi:hypothetical protein